MNINNTQIASTTSQPLNSNAHNEASISQLIWPGILPTSQPLLISDQSKFDTVTRHREAQLTRRRRRAPSEHQHLAQQIRRRHGREDRDRADYILRRSLTFNEFLEEMIEERLLEVYDWETMHLNDRSKQEQLYELEGIAALEQLSLVQDQTEQSYQLQ